MYIYNIHRYNVCKSRNPHQNPLADSTLLARGRQAPASSHQVTQALCQELLVTDEILCTWMELPMLTSGYPSHQVKCSENHRKRLMFYLLRVPEVSKKYWDRQWNEKKRCLTNQCYTILATHTKNWNMVGPSWMIPQSQPSWIAPSDFPYHPCLQTAWKKWPSPIMASSNSLNIQGEKINLKTLGWWKKSCKTYWVSKPLYASVHPNMA